ncbi:molybdopterin-dependent oxidoreductase [Chloroflexota bacterium]
MAVSPSDTKKKPEIWEDVWIHTCCGGCYGTCGVKVHRVNGMPIAIEGEEGSTLGAEGGLCAKGVAQLQVLFDPNRRNYPMRRTNPKKGLYEEGNFERITWEEAMAEIVPRLKKIREEDTRKLVWMSSPSPNAVLRHNLLMPFFVAYGKTSLMGGGAAVHCGNGAHHVTGQYYGAWDAGPDWKYCNYAMFFGASGGFGSGHAGTMNIRMAAEARERGMKMVVFDPMCNNTGDKATEWIPILPGTDGAVLIAMINIILNELNIYDAPYVKTKTNGSYLIGPDQLYVRDPETGKPMIWDTEDKKAKTFNDPTIRDYALEGEYEVNGVKCRPSFELIKEHVKTYTPEYAEQESTVPAKTIRRIAKEFAEAAQVGSTIMIDGVELPYRPVATAIFRGGQGHTNSLHAVYATHIIGQILGAADVPGSTIALCPSRCFGDPNTGRPEISCFADEDGMLVPGLWSTLQARTIEDYIPRHGEPTLPCKSTGLQDLFTQGMSSVFHSSKDRHELWDKLGVEFKPEMLLSWATNNIHGLGNPETVAEAVAEIPFVVCWEIFPTELSEGFADIVLPGCHKLEHTTSCADAYDLFFNSPIAYEDWSVHITQPVIEPQYERKFIADVFFELAEELGFMDEYNQLMNMRFNLKDKYVIKPGEKLNLTEISDRVLKANHGDDKGMEWFKENGFIRWPKKPEEAYWRPFLDVRVPIYLHDLARWGPTIIDLAESRDVHADWQQYTPFVSWFPTPVQKVPDTEFDLICYSYRTTLHTGGQTHQIPYLVEASHMNPHIYNIVINRDTGKAKGFADGDIVTIESNYSRKTTGPVILSDCVHPKCIGIASTAGHWVKGQTIAYGQGVHFNTLMEIDLEHSDPVCLSIETSAKVKVYKAGGKAQ